MVAGVVLLAIIVIVAFGDISKNLFLVLDFKRVLLLYNIYLK